MPSSHLIFYRPLFLLPPIPPSIRVFSNESTLHMKWPKYWSFNFSIIPSKEIPGLISFRMDCMMIIILCIYFFLFCSSFVIVENCFLFSVTTRLSRETGQETSLKAGGTWKRNVAQRMTRHPACYCRAFPGPPTTWTHLMLPGLTERKSWFSFPFFSSI